MTLSAKLSLNSTEYSLLCERIEHTFTRMVAQVGLPTTEGTEGPVITLDLGSVLQQIALTGTVNTVSSGSGDPTKADLDLVCTTWWAYGDSATVLPVLDVPGGAYYVNLKNASFSIMGEWGEKYWTFSITFLVREKSS
jgi:hypothetical protein